MKYVLLSYIDGIRQYYTHFENNIPAKQVKNMILLYFLLNAKKNINVDIINVELNDYVL